MNLLVVGAGAMGQWFASTVEADVAFADVDPDAARAAADEFGGRTVDLDGEEHFDTVCLAVPMTVVEDAIAAQAHRTREAIVDVTGVMDAPLKAMAAHAPERERVSFHPLFAPENAPGNVAVVADAPGPVTDAIRDSMAAAGNHPFETTAEAHDHAMETVQASAHAAILAFGLAAEDVDPAFATPVYEDLRALLEHVTDGTSRVYADIQATFDGADAVARAAERIATADDETFEALYRDARLGDPSSADATIDDSAIDDSRPDDA